MEMFAKKVKKYAIFIKAKVYGDEKKVKWERILSTHGGLTHSCRKLSVSLHHQKKIQ